MPSQNLRGHKHFGHAPADVGTSHRRQHEWGCELDDAHAARAGMRIETAGRARLGYSLFDGVRQPLPPPYHSSRVAASEFAKERFELRELAVPAQPDTASSD